MKNRVWILIALTLGLLAAAFYFRSYPETPGEKESIPRKGTPLLASPRWGEEQYFGLWTKGFGTGSSGGDDLGKNDDPLVATSTSVVRNDQLKQQFLDQLEKKETSQRRLRIPKAGPKPVLKRPVSAAQPLAPAEQKRSEGRKKRENLPMGVVLRDNISVYDNGTGNKKIYGVMSGDFVRVLSNQGDRIQVHPGLDLYLAATTKDIQPAGERLPDLAGWVNREDLHVFAPEQAKEFILELSPVTLGADPSFSTLAFYERAMKNPDPVVHRIIAPRLMVLVGLHEEYATSWFQLYRDRDPKVRDAALASLRERGIGQSRPLIEDLILRLSELTQGRARGETEQEVLLILRTLKESSHPRVPAALASFKESWKDTQGERLNDALSDILQTP